MTRAVLIAACAAWMCTACSRSADFERMRQQQRVNPFAARVDDVVAMRLPPAGAVPTDTEEEAPGDAARGRQPFETFCSVCHGADGSGRSLMAGNMTERPSLSLIAGDAASSAPAQLFDVISHGRKRMPAFDWSIPAGDRWDVVAYIRTLQRQSVTAPEGQTP